MRRDLGKVLVLAVLATPAALGQEARQPSSPAAAARPQPPTGRPPAAANDARMKRLLVTWETKSSALKTLDVQIRRVDKSEVWGSEQFEGRAILKSPDLAWLNFQKVVEDDKTGKTKLAFHDRIICTGTEVWQYNSDLKQIFIFPLNKQDQKRAVLEEGPLPFLFNMRAAEAESRYIMTLTNETKEFFVIGILPRLRIDKESFSKAFLRLNRETYLPDRIYLVSPDEKSTKDFTLSMVKPNARVMDKNFEGRTIPGWQVVRDPGNQGGAPQVGVGARPKVPAARQRQGGPLRRQ